MSTSKTIEIKGIGGIIVALFFVGLYAFGIAIAFGLLLGFILVYAVIAIVDATASYVRDKMRAAKYNPRRPDRAYVSYSYPNYRRS
jgi:hypothetical protein